MKKHSIIIGIIILVITSLLFYFQPLKLSNLVSKNSDILVTRVELGIQNGEAYNNSSTYNDLTDEQKNSITNLLQSYSYRRTFGTTLSDGSLSGIGDEMIHIFIYEGSTFVHNISISTTGSISVDDKTYTMKSAAQLIDKIVEIIDN
ncbi:hypothetical protein ABXS75_17520 [Roseburia hominis]